MPPYVGLRLAFRLWWWYQANRADCREIAKSWIALARKKGWV